MNINIYLISKMKYSHLLVLFLISLTYISAVTYYPACSSSYSSIIDALNSIGVDSSYSNRKSIAEINGIYDYSGSYDQNLKLLNLLKQGKLIKSSSGDDPEPTDYRTDAPTDYRTDIPAPEPTDYNTDAPTDYRTDIPAPEPTDYNTDAPTDYRTDIPAPTPSSRSEMIGKLVRSSTYFSKRNTLKIIGNLLFDKGYPTSWVAGVLGNIFSEASIGKFESSAYIKNPSAEPQYLKYMDQFYDYRNKYSGKIVTDVSMKALGLLLTKLKNDNWIRGKFGLGCVQWTGERTYTLYKKYVAACNYQDRITLDQATKAEGNMIIEELSGRFSDIYSQWNSGNSNKNSGSAAYDAGYRICKKYEIPADTENQAKKRGKTAQNIYEIMTS